MMAHEKEPVPTPRHVAIYIAIIGNRYFHVCRAAVTGNVIDGYFTAVMQHSRHNTHRGLNLVFARSNPVHIRQRCDQPNGSMAAHAEVADIIKEDDTGGALRVQRLAE